MLRTGQYSPDLMIKTHLDLNICSLGKLFPHWFDQFSFRGAQKASVKKYVHIVKLSSRCTPRNSALLSRGGVDCFHSIFQCIPTLVPLRLAGRLDPCWFDLETKVSGPRILESLNTNQVFSILSAMFLLGDNLLLDDTEIQYSIGYWKVGFSV